MGKLIDWREFEDKRLATVVTEQGDTINIRVDPTGFLVEEKTGLFGPTRVCHRETELERTRGAILMLADDRMSQHPDVPAEIQSDSLRVLVAVALNCASGDQLMEVFRTVKLLLDAGDVG